LALLCPFVGDDDADDDDDDDDHDDDATLCYAISMRARKLALKPA